MRKLRLYEIRAVHNALISCLTVARSSLCLAIPWWLWVNAGIDKVWSSVYSFVDKICKYMCTTWQAYTWKLNTRAAESGFVPRWKTFSGPPARADRLKISTRDLHWCAKRRECPTLPCLWLAKGLGHGLKELIFHCTNNDTTDKDKNICNIVGPQAPYWITGPR
jgi:hypothetical protein